MRRVAGWSEDDLIVHEQVFEGLTSKAIRLSVRSLSAELTGIITSAAADHDVVKLSGGGVTTTLKPVFTLDRLGVVVSTWAAYVADELLPYLRQVFRGSAAATRAGTEATLDVSVPPTSPLYAEDFLRAAQNKMIGIGDLIWSELTEQLALGYAAGEDVQQLATRVRGVANLSTPRALMTARTQVQSAANAGSFAQMMTAGFTDEECAKVWDSTHDDRTRLAHVDADGQTVPLSQPFSVGGEGLLFPGDPTGRPDNIIQCRCTLTYEFADDIAVNDVTTDAELVVAAKLMKTKGSKFTDDFDELEHPRGFDGKFVKHGAGVGAPAGGKGWPTADQLSATGKSAGTHGSQFYVDKSTGDKFLFKKYPSSDFLAEVDVATADLGQKLGLPTPDVTKFELNGVQGTLHRVVPKATTPFDQLNFDAKKELSSKDVADLQREQIFDWLISNHDSHADNFIRDGDGQLIGIDKGQAFKFFAHGQLTPEYKPNVSGNYYVPIYVKMMRAYVNGDIDLHALSSPEVSNFIDRVEGLSDADVRAAFRPYAQKAAAKGFLATGYKSSPNPQLAVDEFLDKLVARKNNIRQDFKKLYGDLEAARAQKTGKHDSQLVAVAPADTAPTSKVMKLPSPVGPSTKPAAPTVLTKGKPIKINTKVTYNTKYDPGEVVAVQLNDKPPQGPAKQLRWSASDEKFLYLTQSSDGSWKTTEKLGKGAAYKKFKDEDGWTTPPIMTAEQHADITQQVVAKHAAAGVQVKQVNEATSTPSSPNPGEWNPAKLHDMNKTQVNKYFDELTADEWAEMSPDAQGTLEDVAINHVSKGNYYPYSKIGKLEAAQHTNLSAGKKVAPADDIPMPHLNVWLNNTTQDEYDAMDPLEQIKLFKIVKNSNSSAAMAKFDELEVGKFALPIDANLTGPELSAKLEKKILEGDLTDVSVSELGEWLDEVAPDQWFDLLPSKKNQIRQAALDFFHGGEGAAVLNKVNELNNLEVMASVMTPTPTPEKLNFEAAHVGSLSDMGFAKWFGKITINDWVKIDEDNKQKVLKRAANVKAPTIYHDVNVKITALANAGALKTANAPGVTVVPATKPSLAMPKGGQPIKINTKVVYNTKYAHGDVVAIKPNASYGLGERLVWNEYSGQFTLQYEAAPGKWIDTTHLDKFKFNKGEAYKKFKDDDGWTTPPPGATAMWTGTLEGKTPTISTGDAPKVSLPPPPPPPPPPAPLQSLTPETLVKQLGDISGISPEAQSKLRAQVTHGVGAPPWLPTTGHTTHTSQQHKMFKAVANTVYGWNKNNPDQPVTMLQVLKILDSSSKLKYATGPLWEEQIVKWLGTPSGAATAKKHTQLLTDAAGGAPKTDAPSPAIFTPGHIGTPDASVTTFEKVTSYGAEVMQEKMLQSLPWTPAQKGAVKAYTGNFYQQINAALRKPSAGTNPDVLAKGKLIQNAMRPTTSSIIVHRGTTGYQFPPHDKYSLSEAELNALVGKTVVDKGFVSTSVTAPKGASALKLVIEVPKGTPAAYVKALSQYQSEDELLLAAGTKFKIISVDAQQSTVRMRVVP